MCQTLILFSAALSWQDRGKKWDISPQRAAVIIFVCPFPFHVNVCMYAYLEIRIYHTYLCVSILAYPQGLLEHVFQKTFQAHTVEAGSWLVGIPVKAAHSLPAVQAHELRAQGKRTCHTYSQFQSSTDITWSRAFTVGWQEQNSSSL